MSFAHLRDVLAEVEALGRRFAAAGYRLFLVGGIVRDQWLDEPLDGSSDIDLTTDALPRDIKRIVTDLADDLWTQGEKFGTIGLRANGRDFEITTHRAESYASDSRKPQVSFGDDITVDLSRRDFTVNAMAIELPDGDLVDPYQGAADLQAGLLRTPLSADISFSDDPLRMLRAARFATRFGLAPVDEISESATRLHERLRIVAIERIGVEMKRLLGLERADIGLRWLADTGLLREVLAYGEPALGPAIQPRLAEAIETAERVGDDSGSAARERSEQEREHRPGDPWASTNQAVSWQLRLAAIGVRVFDDADGVYAMCRRLRLARDDERCITRVSRDALTIVGGVHGQPDLRRWLASADDPDRAVELAAVLADDPALVDAFSQALDELRTVEAGDPQVFLDGAAIMSALDITPGPVVGQATNFLHECYFESGPLAQSEQLARLKSWWSDRATNT